GRDRSRRASRAAGSARARAKRGASRALAAQGSAAEIRGRWSMSGGGAAAKPAHSARHATLAIGTTIGGRYRIDGVIGEGAHSVVCLAREGDTRVALKVIHRHLTGDPQISKRFHREAAILRKLEGEHIVRLLELVEEDGLLAIALEYVEGTSLEAMLEAST